MAVPWSARAFMVTEFAGPNPPADAPAFTVADVFGLLAERLDTPDEMVVELLRTYAFVTDASVNDTARTTGVGYLQALGDLDSFRVAFESALFQCQVALDKLREL